MPDPNPSSIEPLPPPLDLAKLDEWRHMDVEGQPSFLLELVEAFKEEAPELLDGIRAAVQSGDPVKLWQSAHSLKGGSGNLGAKRLQDLCAALEKIGRIGILDGAAELAGHVERECQRVIEALEVEAQK